MLDNSGSHCRMTFPPESQVLVRPLFSKIQFPKMFIAPKAHFSELDPQRNFTSIYKKIIDFRNFLRHFSKNFWPRQPNVS